MVCDKCGYNPDKLTEYMKTVIPKAKIKHFMEKRQKLIDEIKLKYPDNNTVDTLVAFFELQIKELKDLLGQSKK